MYVACPFELESKPYLRSNLECDEKKKKTSRRQSLSPSLFSLRGLYLFVCKYRPRHSGEGAEICLPEWGRRQHSSGPGARVGFDQPREKNVNICLSLHGKWPIIIFFFSCRPKLQSDKATELPALSPAPFPTTAPPLIC